MKPIYFFLGLGGLCVRPGEVFISQVRFNVLVTAGNRFASHTECSGQPLHVSHVFAESVCRVFRLLDSCRWFGLLLRAMARGAGHDDDEMVEVYWHYCRVIHVSLDCPSLKSSTPPLPPLKLMSKAELRTHPCLCKKCAVPQLRPTAKRPAAASSSSSSSEQPKSKKQRLFWLPAPCKSWKSKR